MVSKFKEDLATIMEVLVGSYEEEVIGEHKEHYEKLKGIYEENPKRFFRILEMTQNRLDLLVSQIVDIPRQKNMYILEFVTNGLYKHFFETLMKKTEGSTYCADKSNFITNTTLKALKEKKNFSLYEDYSNYNFPKDKDKQAYWSPRTIKDTDEAMALFWSWYLLETPKKEANNIKCKFCGEKSLNYVEEVSGSFVWPIDREGNYQDYQSDFYGDRIERVECGSCEASYSFEVDEDGKIKILE